MNEEDDRTRVVTYPALRAGANRQETAFGANHLPLGFVLADFEIESVIGEGGFSIVYLARDRQLDRRTALKEYMPGSLAMRRPDLAITVKSDRVRDTFEAGLRSFVNEARILAHFDHPALVKVFRFWEERATAYMAMPYYEGDTLKQALKKGSAAPDEAWLRSIFEPLFDAIELLHGENCYHRDIAPDNIMILSGGSPLLLDFGAARHVIGDMTQALTAILKPGYAPIEQYAETRTIRQGPWTDIYAIAAVLYWAVTGKVPSPSVGRLMNDDLIPAAAAALKGYSDRFLAGIQAGLAIKPEERPQSIAEFRNLLGYRSQPSLRRAAILTTDDAPTVVPAPEPRVPTIQEAPTFVPVGLPSQLSAPDDTISAARPRPVLWRYLLLGALLAAVLAAAWFAFRPGAAPTPVPPPVVAPPVNNPPAPVFHQPSEVTPLQPPPSPPEQPKAQVPKVEPHSEVVEPPKSHPSPPKRPRRNSAVTEPPGGSSADRACADLLQQMSLGLNTPELRAKLATLNCGTPH
jgi:serine/threonine protein kinase